MIINDFLNHSSGKEADHVVVNTVDQFQGEEKDIVIVSCVRARDVPGNLGLLSSLHLTKVFFLKKLINWV